MRNIKKLRLIYTLPILALLVFPSFFSGCSNEINSGGEKINIIEALSSSDTEGYSIADKVLDFSFPDDHGPHESFRNSGGILPAICTTILVTDSATS